MTERSEIAERFLAAAHAAVKLIEDGTINGAVLTWTVEQVADPVQLRLRTQNWEQQKAAVMKLATMEQKAQVLSEGGKSPEKKIPAALLQQSPEQEKIIRLAFSLADDEPVTDEHVMRFMAGERGPAAALRATESAAAAEDDEEGLV